MNVSVEVRSVILLCFMRDINESNGNKNYSISSFRNVSNYGTS